MLYLITSDISPFSFLHYALRLAGLMINDGRPWSLINTFLHLLLVSSGLILAVLEVILGNDELEKLVSTLSSVTIFSQLVVKLIVMLANENKVRTLIHRLVNYRSELLNDAPYENQIREADQACKKYSTLFYILFISFPIFSFVANFINDYSTNFQQPHLTHHLWIPWNMNHFWGYTAASVSVLTITLSAIIVHASCAVFHLVFTLQMSTYLKILQDRLETKGPNDKVIYSHHKMINQFLMDYNEIYSGPLLVEVSLASLMPCGFGYAMIKGFRSNKPPAADTYHMIICTFGPFCMYYFAQEISTQMERLHESTYMSKWYEEKPKVRRDLYTMMLVTIRPVTLNYRLFVTFDMKCGTTIVQGLYSYLMMIIHFETEN